jgi:hypothetical protein
MASVLFAASSLVPPALVYFYSRLLRYLPTVFLSDYIIFASVIIFCYCWIFIYFLDKKKAGDALLAIGIALRKDLSVRIFMVAAVLILSLTLLYYLKLVSISKNVAVFAYLLLISVALLKIKEVRKR